MISVFDRFDIPFDAVGLKPLGHGLINDTYLVETDGDAPGFVLQRINHEVFKDVETLQANIEAVTTHLRHKRMEQGVSDLSRRVLRFEKVRDTCKSWLYDGQAYWRVSRFIPGSRTVEEVTPLTARCAGEAIGEFHFLLSDIGVTLRESIPKFHNMEFRLDQMREAVAGDACGRLVEVSDIVEELERHAADMCRPEEWHRQGLLPKRICHCDTKVNNLLFDTQGNVLCVIDLDTVMPSFVSSDYGDFLRTAACTAPEDEPCLDKIGFDMEIYRAFKEGYLSQAHFLTDVERELLPLSVAMFPYMQAVRFLTDYLNGDIYYKTRYPGHNLVRARAQLQFFRVVTDLLPDL